jgi:hypothetical protein
MLIAKNCGVLPKLLVYWSYWIIDPNLEVQSDDKLSISIGYNHQSSLEIIT